MPPFKLEASAIPALDGTEGIDISFPENSTNVKLYAACAAVKTGATQVLNHKSGITIVVTQCDQDPTMIDTLNEGFQLLTQITVTRHDIAGLILVNCKAAEVPRETEHEKNQREVEQLAKEGEKKKEQKQEKGDEQTTWGYIVSGSWLSGRSGSESKGSKGGGKKTNTKTSASKRFMTIAEAQAKAKEEGREVPGQEEKPQTQSDTEARDALNRFFNRRRR